MAIEDYLSDYWQKWRSYRRKYEPRAASSGGVLPPLPSVSTQQPATPGPQPLVPEAVPKPHWSAPIYPPPIDPLLGQQLYQPKSITLLRKQQAARAGAQAGSPINVKDIYDVLPLNLYWSDVAAQRYMEAKREDTRNQLMQALLQSLSPGAWRLSDVGSAYWKAQADERLARLNTIAQTQKQRIEEMYRSGRLSAPAYRRMLEEIELRRALEAGRIQEQLAAERERAAMQWAARRTQGLLGAYGAVPRDRLRLPYPPVAEKERKIRDVVPTFLSRGKKKKSKAELAEEIQEMFPGAESIRDLSIDDWQKLVNRYQGDPEAQIYLRQLFERLYKGKRMQRNPQTGQWEPEELPE